MIAQKKHRLEQMASTSRLWIFQSSKKISGELFSHISERLDSFLSSWAAHGSELFSGFDIRHDRFIIIAVDEALAPATGCSIDGMMAVIQELDQSYNLDLLNRMKVAYRQGDEVRESDMNSFREMLVNGSANAETKVFNNILGTLGQMEGEWEVPVSKSWHANLLS